MFKSEIEQQRRIRSYDLADHFVACAKLGRYLTVASDNRFLITDDFQNQSIIHEATAIAAIYSKDSLVAEAALMPLGITLTNLKGGNREKYERLFHLIEQEALSDDVRNNARSIIDAKFRVAEIRNIERELGGKISPARKRYRLFLDVVKKLINQNITAKTFLDEFKDFTNAVAGKLDFGIYSFCLDSLFQSYQVPSTVKKLLVIELTLFPPLIRRELLSNVLIYPNISSDLLKFSESVMEKQLMPEVVIEIGLLKDLKLRKFSMEAISELANNSGLGLLH